MNRYRIAFSAAFALVAAGCGQAPLDASNSEVPLSSELAMEPGDVEAGDVQQPDPQPPDPTKPPPSVLRFTRDAVVHLNGDLRDLLDRVRDLVAGHQPTISDRNHRVWVIRDQDRVIRLSVERTTLGTIQYTPEDEMPEEAGVRDDLPALDAKVVAFRFVLEVKRVTEDDGAYRLAAHGHVVRLQGEPLGTGALAVRREHVEELMGQPMAERTNVAVRFDHRGRVLRQIARIHVQDSDGKDVRVAWALRRLSDRTGAIEIARFGDLPFLPVSGGKPELVIAHEEWLRTAEGLVARAHARVLGGDLGPDVVNVIECVDAPDHLGFRVVILPNGQPWAPGAFGDPAACRPFDRDETPNDADDDRLPPLQPQP